jgi:hypothetical protein
MNDQQADPRLYPDRPFLSASVAVFRDGKVLLASRTAASFTSKRWTPCIGGGAARSRPLAGRAGTRP